MEMDHHTGNPHQKYMKEKLVPEIVSNFKNEEFLDVEIQSASGLDGFMSALYTLTLRTKISREAKSSIKERIIIAKFMKGDDTFRESSKSYTQFANEVFIYDKVLPAYDKLLKLANVTDVSVEDWVAHCYVAKFGCIEGLSASSCIRESVLALENLKPYGYLMGPRLYLDREHLSLMASKLAQYHSMSYVLRHCDEKQFEMLRSQIIPLPFVNDSDPEDDKRNLYKVLYRVAFDRFFDYFDRMEAQNQFDRNNPGEAKLVGDLRRLREKHFGQPAALLEQLRTRIEENERDRQFGVILHGDYNRNNVMFRYEKDPDSTNASKVTDMKLIDFQELRYGSPALDLSFFMFINTPEELRAEIWLELLKNYHSELHKTMEKTLKGLQNAHAEVNIHKLLENYSFEKFNAHFSRFAFYGVMICLHFLPWLLSTEAECSELSQYFETDMHSKKFYQISMSAGGDGANKCILNVVRHASKMGYMDHL